MAFRAYKSLIDGSIHYAFEGEETKRLPHFKDYDNEVYWENQWWMCYEKLPPEPSTILATATFMTDMPYLDSIKTIYELDRILNIEAEQEREDKGYQEMIKNI